MAEATPTRGNKRNSLSRGEDGLDLPLNKRMQSPVVFTGSDGKIHMKNRNGENYGMWPARPKFDSAKAKQQILLRQEESAGDMSSNTTSKKPSCLRQPTFSTPQSERVKSVHFQTPICNSLNPGDSPLPASRTPVGTIEYATTPLPSSKARPPLSGRKMKIKAAAKLQALDEQEIQASRFVQAQLDFSMGRQERAYIAWLNYVLDKSSPGGCRTFSVEDNVARNSSLNALSSSSGAGDFTLIDEVYWDEDCGRASPRIQSSLGRSPRSALKPLNGLASRNTGSPATKRPLKDTFTSAMPEKLLLARAESPATPYLSSKRLKMITEHGFSYSRDVHMQDVCRLSDLARRLKLHFSQNEREEILTVVTQLAKHIDEGRLRMKKGCAILVDVALRKKALYVLLNYNTYWLRIGLHVVLGHTALLKKKLTEDAQGVGHKEHLDEEYALLEVFLERHFFAHSGLSKAYATNKAIDGLYRDGYTEALGRVILKRFFLLVLVLDKAKRQTSLKISDGIDGLDGGSPTLFRSDARVKSSRQVLQEFLSDVMHGEGDVIGNLGNLGYHVYHHQVPLADYDFAVVDLIEDLQDGVRLCRLVQLLAASDTFILEHVHVPPNGRKRQLHNCQIALESLAQAGVPLEDEEGCSISAEDIVGGNRDKVFPLLWNIMVHLQIPLLVSRPRLCQEIAKLQGTEGGFALGLNIGTVELLLKWTQVACMISGNLNIRNFKTSFADGQALCYIVNLYLPLFLPESDVLRPHCHMNVQIDSTPNFRGLFSPAYKKSVAHNFGLVQAVARKLGNIPEVLQLVDLLGDPAMSEKNIIIFVAFLCSKLLKDEPLDIQVQERRDFVDWEALESHPLSADDGPALCSYLSRCSLESDSPVGFDRSYTVSWPKDEFRRSITSPPAICSDIFCDVIVNNPAPVAEYSEISLRPLCKVQAWWRGRRAREQFLRTKRAVQTIQKGWRSFSRSVRILCATKIQAHWRGYLLRHMFLRWKEAALIHRECYEREQAALVIQAYYRAWIQKRKYRETVSTMCKIQALWWVNEARGNFLTQLKAVRTIESAWLVYLARKRTHYRPLVLPYWHQYTARQSLIRLSTASSLNQSWFRNHFEQYDDEDEYKMINVQGWLQDSELQSTEYYIAVIQGYWRARIARKQFLKQKQAALLIQRHWREFLTRKRHTAAIRIQATWKCLKCSHSFIEMKSSAITIQCFYRGNLERRKCQRQMQSVIRLQARCRGLFQRRRYQAAVKNISTIQTRWRACKARKQFIELKRAVLNVQASWQGYQCRKKLRKSVEAVSLLQKWYRGVVQRRAFMRYRDAAVIIQTIWRSRNQRRRYFEERKCAVLIQSHYRACTQRRREKIVQLCKIQAAWRALRIRKQYLEQRKAATTVQAYFRAYRLGRKIREHFSKQRSAVLCIERCYIAFGTRMDLTKSICASRIQRTWRTLCVRREFLKRRKAAIVIQRCFQAHLRRKTAEYEFSVRKVQASWRAFKERRHFVRQKSAVELIQNRYRSFIERKSECSLRSICKVQAIWRASNLRSKFLLLKRSAVQIQAHYRCYKARQEFLRQKRASSVIRAYFRAFSQTRFRAIIEPTFCGTVRRICRIQAVWRALKARRMITSQRRAAETIQNAWRLYLKERVNLRRKLAAVHIQALFRGLLQRRNFRNARESVHVLQAHVKGWMQRRRYRKALENVCKIQALFRAKIVRVHYGRQKEAASKIQAAWRGTFVRRMILEWRKASTAIQVHFRGFAERKRFKININAVVRCQALIKGHLVSQRIERSKVGSSGIHAVPSDADRCMAAVYIQSVFRGWKDRQRISALLQAKEIGNQLRENLSTQNPRKFGEKLIHSLHSDVSEGVDFPQYEDGEQTYAAVMIQACWKRFCVRKIFALNTQKQHNVCVQKQFVDGVVEASFVQKFTSHELSAGQTILRWIVFWRHRSYFVKLRKVAPVIQRHVRGWLCRCKFMQTRNLIISLQAHWRGFLLRREISQVNQELRKLCQRIQCTAATVQDSDRLGNRLTEALALLLGQKTVTGILSICRTIDVATQHSRSCCDRLAEAGAVTKILNLIQTINRSPPHEQVLKHALAILTNLSHHLHLRILIAGSPGAVSIVSEILHMFRTKEDVFAKALELLRQVCELPLGLEVLQRETPIFRRLQLVAQSLDRKFQVEKRNLERLPPTTAPVQRKLAEKKVIEAASQVSAIITLMKDITKLEHSQRRKTTPISVPTPSASKRLPLNCRRPSLATRPSNLGPRLAL